MSNLARFISVMKFRPRSSGATRRPAVLVARFEDVTPPAAIARDPLLSRSRSASSATCAAPFTPGMRVQSARASATTR